MVLCRIQMYAYAARLFLYSGMVYLKDYRRPVRVSVRLVLGLGWSGLFRLL